MLHKFHSCKKFPSLPIFPFLTQTLSYSSKDYRFISFLFNVFRLRSEFITGSFSAYLNEEALAQANFHS